MKRFAPLCCALLLGTGMTAWSQDCSQYLFLQLNKTIEMTIYNKKGEPTGRQVYTVSNVGSAGGTTTGTLATQLFDKKGRVTAGTTSTVKCNGGALQMDLKMMMAPGGPADRMNNTNAQVSGDNLLEYPNGMKPGDTLKSANLYMTATNGPITQALTVLVFDRKVEGQESVTTTAGTWNCFKISYKSKVNFRSGPFPVPTFTVNGTEWYAPGVGIIRTESQHGSTAITSIK